MSEPGREVLTSSPSNLGRLRQEDGLTTGIQDNRGQHRETLFQKRGGEEDLRQKKTLF